MTARGTVKTIQKEIYMKRNELLLCARSKCLSRNTVKNFE